MKSPSRTTPLKELPPLKEVTAGLHSPESAKPALDLDETIAGLLDELRQNQKRLPSLNRSQRSYRLYSALVYTIRLRDALHAEAPDDAARRW